MTNKVIRILGQNRAVILFALSCFLFLVNVMLCSIDDIIIKPIFGVILAVTSLWLISNIILLIKHFKYLKLVSDYEESCKDISSIYVEQHNGTPGTGKTLSAINKGLIVAESLWEELQFRAFMYQSEKASIIQRNDPDELIKMNEVLESYKFWREHEEKVIPCFMCNIPVEDDKGRKAAILTKEYFYQSKKMPFLTCLVSDEIGAEFECCMANMKSKFETVSDFFRWCRQFRECRIISTEQEETNTFKNIRRVTASNIKIVNSRWELSSKPARFVFKLCRKKALALLDKNQQGSMKFIRFIKLLSLYINSTGFTIFTADRIVGNRYIIDEEDRLVEVPNQFEFVVKRSLPFKYDSRAFKNLYLARARSIEEDIQFFEYLALTEGQAKARLNKQN